MKTVTNSGNGTPNYRAITAPQMPNVTGRKTTTTQEHNCLVRCRGLWRPAVYSHSQQIGKIDMVHFAKLCAEISKQPQTSLIPFMNEEFKQV